jgi:phosphoglycerate dehydrogenase-like enzyme
MTMLMLATQVEAHARALRQGRWIGSGHLGGDTHDELYGKTLGIIGYGHIGRAVADRARAFGMRVLAIRTKADATAGGPESLPELLAASDYILISAPLNESTRGMLGRAQLASCRPGARLINVSRAGLVEEEALYDALKQGPLAGAALDVWYQYPPTSADTLHGSRFPFHELPNVIPTPHFSAWTQRMIGRRIASICENLDCLARGEPLKRVVFIGTGPV